MVIPVTFACEIILSLIILSDQVDASRTEVEGSTI